MARTRLFRLFQQAWGTLRGARRAGVSVEEFLQKPRPRGLTRRQMLQVSGGALALAAMPGCSSSSKKSIAIVGAGMAGLHCAYRLKQAGINATIYEASTTRTGGRMFSDRMTFADPDMMHCELGGELIDTGHQTMHDLAMELGIDLLDYSTDDPSLSDTYYFGGSTLSTMDVLTGFTPIAMQIDAALGTLTDPNADITYDAPNGATALDTLSIKGWLDSVNASGPVRTLLEVAYNIEFGLEVDQQSALNLLIQISTDTTDFQIFGASDERFHTKTGNDTYISKLQALLNPAQIKMGYLLNKVSETAAGRVTLGFDNGGSSVEATYDHVVLALPFTLLRACDLSGLTLSAVKSQAIQQLGYGTNAKIMLGFSSRPWRTVGSTGEIFTDIPTLQNTWETSRLQPGNSGILTDYTGGNLGVSCGQGTPESQMATALGALDMTIPGLKAASNGKVVRMHWPTYPLTLASYACYTPGQWTGVRGAEPEQVGNLHFAGEHTSLDFQGFMEGAAESGAAAAMEVLNDLGIKVQAASLAEARILERARTPRFESKRRIRRLG
jgi:monoamine oxidase